MAAFFIFLIGKIYEIYQTILYFIKFYSLYNTNGINYSYKINVNKLRFSMHYCLVYTNYQLNNDSIRYLRQKNAWAQEAKGKGGGGLEEDGSVLYGTDNIQKENGLTQQEQH